MDCKNFSMWRYRSSLEQANGMGSASIHSSLLCKTLLGGEPAAKKPAVQGGKEYFTWLLEIT